MRRSTKAVAAVAVAVALALSGAPASARADAAAGRMRRAGLVAGIGRGPGFSQAGDDALLPTDAGETDSERKPFRLENEGEEQAIEDHLGRKSNEGTQPGPSDEDTKATIAAEEAARARRGPGQGKPCGEWDCSGKGLCYDGVCRCHEDWHGDDCSTKYLAGEKRERRERPAPAPKTAKGGGQTVGAAAEKEGALTAENQEVPTESEAKALDEATGKAESEGQKAAKADADKKEAERPTEDLADALNDEKKANDKRAGKTPEQVAAEDKAAVEQATAGEPEKEAEEKEAAAKKEKAAKDEAHAAELAKEGEEIKKTEAGTAE